ncbi:unnamed protein product, partial [marine sediment metagenome]
MISRGESAGDYISKICHQGLGHQGLAAEISQAGSKKGRLASRTVPQIIDDWGDYRRESDRLLLLEWLTGMRGARHLTWSKGFRTQYLPAEQPAQDSDPSTAEFVCQFTGQQTDFLIQYDPTLRWRIPEAAKKHGRPGVMAELASFNFDCQNVPA